MNAHLEIRPPHSRQAAMDTDPYQPPIRRTSSNLRDAARPTRVAAPVAGIWTLAVLVGLVAAVAIWTASSSGAHSSVEDVVRQQSIFAGLTYGLFSGVVWWSSFIQPRWGRWVTVGICGLVLVTWLSVRHDRPSVRYISFFTGMAILQSVAFWLARVPSWVRGPRIRKGITVPSGSSQMAGNQFSLIDLIAMTVAVALLFTAGQQYQTDYPQDLNSSSSLLNTEDLSSQDLENWGSYWVGVVAVWVWLPMVSLFIAMLACCQRWWFGIAFIVLSLLTAGTGAVVMAWLNVIWVGSTPMNMRVVVGDYGTFIVLYAYLFGGLAIAGRWDSLRNNPQTLPAES